jgi:nicotinamidase-related amidase
LTPQLIMASFTCGCGKCTLQFEVKQARLFADCCCFDCHKRMSIAAANGGTAPPAEVVNKQQPVHLAYFPNKFTVKGGVNFYKLTDGSPLIMMLCAACNTVMCLEHPVYGGGSVALPVDCLKCQNAEFGEIKMRWWPDRWTEAQRKHLPPMLSAGLDANGQWVVEGGTMEAVQGHLGSLATAPGEPGAGQTKFATAMKDRSVRVLTTGSLPLEDSRVFTCAEAKGGKAIDPKKTAMVMIEFQNEFVSEGGKLHAGVKAVMEETGMLKKAAALVEHARGKGVKIFHTPITFKPDMSDNPNKNLGILKGCADGSCFVEGTWGATIEGSMTPKDGDVTIKGKHGLDAFPGTTLDNELKAHGIETVAIGGLLTNCCCESTMRTAFEKGYNVVTLTDCMATTSSEGHKAATGGTFGMFSTPMTAEEFKGKLG